VRRLRKGQGTDAGLNGPASVNASRSSPRGDPGRDGLASPRMSKGEDRRDEALPSLFLPGLLPLLGGLGQLVRLLLGQEFVLHLPLTFYLRRLVDIGPDRLDRILLD
jgi:hypothetical protein